MNDFEERMRKLHLSGAKLTEYINRDEKQIYYKTVIRALRHPAVGAVHTRNLIETALQELEMKNHG